MGDLMHTAAVVWGQGTCMHEITAFIYQLRSRPCWFCARRCVPRQPYCLSRAGTTRTGDTPPSTTSRCWSAKRDPLRREKPPLDSQAANHPHKRLTSIPYLLTFWAAIGPAAHLPCYSPSVSLRGTRAATGVLRPMGSHSRRTRRTAHLHRMRPCQPHRVHSRTAVTETLVRRKSGIKSSTTAARVTMQQVGQDGASGRPHTYRRKSAAVIRTSTPVSAIHSIGLPSVRVQIARAIECDVSGRPVGPARPEFDQPDEVLRSDAFPGAPKTAPEPRSRIRSQRHAPAPGGDPPNQPVPSPPAGFCLSDQIRDSTRLFLRPVLRANDAISDLLRKGIDVPPQ